MNERRKDRKVSLVICSIVAVVVILPFLKGGIKSTYEQGFNKLLEQMPEERREIMNDFKEGVEWCEPGQPSSADVCIYLMPKHNQDGQDQGNIVSYDIEKGAIFIKHVEVTPDLAGLALACELVEFKEGPVLSALALVALLEQVSDGKVSSEIGSMIVEYNLNSEQDLLILLNTDKREELFQRLDVIAFKRSSVSNEEMAQRELFYIKAMRYYVVARALEGGFGGKMPVFKPNRMSA